MKKALCCQGVPPYTDTLGRAEGFAPGEIGAQEDVARKEILSWVSFPPARVQVVRFGELRRDRVRRRGLLPEKTSVVAVGGEGVVVCVVVVLKEEREGGESGFG